MRVFKVIIDCSPISKGGGLQVMINTLNALLKNPSNFEYKIIISKSTFKYLPRSIQNNKNIYWIKKNNIFQKLKMLFMIYYILIKFRPHLVYTVFGPQYFKPFTKHLVGFAKPSLIYPRIEENDKFTKIVKDFFAKIIFKLSDYYIVETEIVKKNLSRILKIKSNKIFVLRNSVNPKLLEVNKNKINKKLNPKSNNILVPAAYYPHKNLESLITIASKMLNYRKDFRFILTIDKKIFEEKFYFKIKNNSVKNHIINIGSQSLKSLAKYYLESDFVFLPTLLECSTAVYPESFYFNIPLITSNLEFARELCGEAAVFCNPRDHEECSRSILNLIEDNDLQKRLIANGKKQLNNYITSNERKINLENIFSEIIKK